MHRSNAATRERNWQRFIKGKCEFCLNFNENFFNASFDLIFLQEEIKKALDKACTIIPDRKLRGKCRDAIERKGDEIAEKIIENLSADAICKILEFC